MIVSNLCRALLPSLPEGSMVHGERMVGIQDARGEGTGLPGIQGNAVLYGMCHATEQL